MNKEPLVSVFMVTYNHEKYIAKAIESVLMQKTKFPFQIIIGEDCSKDGTREIVRQYSRNYPDKIKAIMNAENLGAQKNAENVYKACKGKYIAMLEGDDYWTDPGKLQVQVDFLKVSTDYSACFHNATIITDSSKKQWPYCSFKGNKTFTLDDILKSNFIPTSSIVFRNEIDESFIEKIVDLNCGDWALHIYNAEKGKIFYTDRMMSVYRAHNQGVWVGLSREDMIKFRIDALIGLNQFFDYKYDNQFRQVLYEIALKKQCGLKDFFKAILLKFFKIKV
jgi:glycosyltransferase involved in cell wall biosynthesis